MREDFLNEETKETDDDTMTVVDFGDNQKSNNYITTHNDDHNHHNHHNHLDTFDSQSHAGHAHGSSEPRSRKRNFINLILSLLILLVTPFVISIFTNSTIESVRQEYAETIGTNGNDVRLAEVETISVVDASSEGLGPARKQIVTLENAVVLENTVLGDSELPPITIGSRVFYQVFENQFDGQERAIFVDVYRIPQILWLLAIFLACVVLLTGLKGLSAFVGLAFSTVIIFQYMLPEILVGNSIIWITFISAVAIAGFSMYMSHGVNKPTSIAVIGTLGTVGLTLVISIIAESVMNFSGVSSHELSHLQSLQTLNQTNIDLRGLFLASIILGTLGVLDDVTIAQSYTVRELFQTNSNISKREVFMSAMRIGQEHIISLVNTLVLAYVATGIPFVIQYIIFGYSDIWVALNSEVISGEIVRAIIGSLSLFLAIPITTFLAVQLMQKKWLYEKI